MTYTEELLNNFRDEYFNVCQGLEGLELENVVAGRK